MVVLQRYDNDAYRDLSTAIANERGERVVSSIDAIQSDETVIYVDPPTAISESALYELYSRSPNDGGIGVITGRTPAEAKALAYREDPGGDEHAIVIRGRNKSATCDDDDAHVLARDEVTANRLEEICSDNLSSLSMRIKARDIHAHLNDGLICGVPSNPEEFDFDGNQPSCIVDGERDCIYSKDLLSAERIAAPHVFICGCSSPLANNHEGLPVNLGLSFLSNAVSLIAPFRPISVHQYHVALNYSLLRAGYTAAERVFLLNQTSAHAGFGLCQYVLFGQPDAVVPAATDQRFDIDYTISDDEYRIHVADADAHVLDFTVPAEPLESDQERFFLQLVSDGQLDKPIFYTTVRDGSEVRVVVWSWGRIETDSIVFDLSSSRVLNQSPHVPALNDVTARVDIGLISGKAKRQFQNSRNQIKGAAYQHRHEPFDANAHESSRSKIQQASDGLGHARKSLVEDLIDRPGNLLQATYANSMYTDDLSVLESGCPYCQRDLHLQTATDVYERTKRSLGVCPFHIYVFDAPFVGGELVYPTIDGGGPPFYYGEEYDFDVSFTNPRERRIDATIALRTMSPEDDYKVFSPTRQSVTIPANETASVSVTLDATELDPDYTTSDCWFEAIVVTDDLQVHTGMRTFFFDATTASSTDL